MTFIEMSLRVVFTFVVLYVMCRILGKKLISQMTFFDFVAGVSLGSISATLIFSDRIPKKVGIYGLVFFAILTLLVDVIALKSYRGRKILNSEPTLVVKNGKILEKGMSKERLTVDQLLLLLRKKNIFYLDQVEYAFFETDGSISVQKKADQQFPKNQDLNIVTANRGIPQTVIIDGKWMKDSLKASGKDKEWFESILEANGIGKVKNVLVAQIDEQEKVFVDKRNDHETL